MMYYMMKIKEDGQFLSYISSKRMIFDQLVCLYHDCYSLAEAKRVKVYKGATMQTKLDCKVIQPQDTYTGKQAFTYFAGISAENTGAQGICMHLLTIQPGQRARAHLHEAHETAIYVLDGEAEMWYGEDLAEHLVVKKGEYLYIPAGMPHLPFNATDVPCTAVIARTDPNEQESVVLLPELEAAKVDG